MMMESKSTGQSGSLRETARKMIRCMGAKNAMSCCLSNHWIGVWQEIQAITGDNSHH